MATYYSNELANTTTGLTTSLPTPYVKPAATAYGARIKRYRATITLASQASGSIFVLANRPAGTTFAFGIVTTDTSTGSTTFKIGVSGADAEYRALAALTATDTPTFFGTAAGVSESASTAEEQIILTTAVGALPASGTLVVDLYLSGPN